MNTLPAHFRKYTGPQIATSWLARLLYNDKSWGVAKWPLFGGNFVLMDAGLDIAFVRCPE